ncbi:hypothetical protein SAMN04487886_10934 [Clostridium sp. DSM 8431]|uniref:hypothetical protein n=1 Tax=Clostridium sp. DSM 8431 TaxID=1761781 RepID=UPI0008EE2F7A|nr:hypothetical protein [Clostridium sp. DSM 8431]SFU66395.1 hypothetical protein SAMN04487886_10934 [Clostridium sp. DSM 8431]
MSKKVIAMLMAAMISVSLAGCSFSSKEDSTKGSQEVVEDETESTGKWARDFTLKDFTQTSDELISKVEKQTKEYGLKYTEDEVVRENNEKTVSVENEKAEKNRLQSMYFSRTLYTEELSSGQIKMKILLNFDGEKAIEENSVDLGSTSIAKYSEILTGISNRDYSKINDQVLEFLKSDSGEGIYTDNVEGLTEKITVTKEYIVYSLETERYYFKSAEQ